MTTADYTSLITSQHNDKPKFMAMVTSDIDPYVTIENILLDIPAQYDIDIAVGSQLDVIGEWVGANRNIPTPLTGVYFKWGGGVSVGWGVGVWKNKFDPATGMTSLPDDSYRKYIKAKIAANKWDGTIEGAYSVWNVIFTDTFIAIKDNQDMSMSVSIAGKPLNAVDQALLVNGYLALKPSGVSINYYAIIPSEGKIFAWGLQNNVFAGWGIGKWGKRI